MSKNIHHLAAQKQRAVKLMKQGKLPAAESVAAKLCKKNKNDAEAHYILGSIYGGMKRYQDAAVCFKTCTKLQPDAVVGHLNLGQAYAALKKYQASELAYRKALALKPGDPDVQVRLAIALAEQGNFSEAKTMLLKLLQKQPRLVDALDVLGDIYYQTEQFQDAIKYYKDALSIAPDRVDSNYYLGNSCFRLGLDDKALYYFQNVINLDPDNISARIHIGHCFKQNGESDKARKAYEEALKIAPGTMAATVGIIDLCEREGAFETAYELLLPQIKNSKENVDLATTFVRLCHRFGNCDEAIEYAQKTLDKENISDQDISRLEYALGRRFDKMGDFETAFSHYNRANLISRQPFDINEHRLFIDALIQVYSWQFFTQSPRAKIRSDRPVFIVGMPRSGTSLVEQILASHPEVFGAGELTDVGDAVQFINAAGQLQYPSNMKDISSDILDDIAGRYLEHINALSSTARRITDKQPINFLHLGLIALLFPDARIIHCTRNPMDNCLSIYFQGFSEANRYATDLEHIGAYYREYLRFMQHITSLIDMPVLNVSYEELVNNQEEVTRNMLAFIDLDWDQQCLNFHKNRRFVATPSYDQVRETIYTNAIDRWKNYEKHLKPLIDSLK